METEIKNTLIKYIEAYYSNNFEIMYDLLYEDDVVNWKNKIVEIALRMDEFGETKTFLERLRFNSISALEKISVKDFTFAMLEISKSEMNSMQMNHILQQIEITEIEDADFLSVVRYQFPVKINNTTDYIVKSKLEMLHTRKGWKILFKPGFENGLKKWQEEVDGYQRRKKHDNLSIFKFEGDLEKYTLTGYKDYTTGRVVIEPRFKHAGEFCNGLALVQIIKKYGYINTKGEIKIKPQFDLALDFSQNMAGVQIETEGKVKKWGFINNRGKLVIEPIFDKVKSFKSGLCAVKMNEKWGFIDKKGQFFKECIFDKASDFTSNSAFVKINKDGKKVSYLLYKNGSMIEFE